MHPFDGCVRTYCMGAVWVVCVYGGVSAHCVYQLKTSGDHEASAAGIALILRLYLDPSSTTFLRNDEAPFSRFIRHCVRLFMPDHSALSMFYPSV